MFKLNNNQSRELGKNLFNLANIIIAIGILTPLITQKGFSIKLLIGSFILYFGLIIISIILTEQEVKKMYQIYLWLGAAMLVAIAGLILHLNSKKYNSAKSK